MKIKNLPRLQVNLRLLLILPLIILIVAAFSSCAARKKTIRTQTEVPNDTPPPPAGVPQQKDGDAYLIVDTMPEFPGGDKALLKYIAENTVYPKQAMKENIQGKVITRFKVRENGTVSDVSVLKGVDPQLDTEAIRVVSAIPEFKPGKLHGVAVPVWYVIPITFTLNDDNHQQRSRFDVTGSDTVYSYTEEMPEFPGGYKALQKFKSDNVIYPDELKSLGVEGVVIVRFLIEKNGSVSNIRIMQGVSPSLDAEAMRVAKLMPAWQPGKDNGKPVKFLNLTNFDFLLTSRSPVISEEGTPYVVVEEMPLFPGGDSALLSYISRNTKYPETAKANKIQGRVIVRFCVTDVGGIDKVTVLKGVNPELDAEAIRVVKTLPAFKPGKQGGKPVNVWYMVPITFQLGKSYSQPLTDNPPKATALPSGYDETPVFKGGESAMYKFINSKLIYPAIAKEKNISGKIDLRFLISPDGSIGEVTVIKGIDPALDAEALRVIKLLPKWEPGKLAGIPVNVWYPVKVTFKLK